MLLVMFTPHVYQVIRWNVMQLVSYFCLVILHGILGHQSDIYKYKVACQVSQYVTLGTSSSPTQKCGCFPHRKMFTHGNSAVVTVNIGEKNPKVTLIHMFAFIVV